MDGNSILYALFGIGGIEHGHSHSFLGAAILATIVASFWGFRSLAWVYGAFLAAFTHILLDMLVHPEMEPMYPIAGNSFYQGWMEPVSLILLPLTIWFIFQSWSCIRDFWKTHREAANVLPEQPFDAKH